METKPLLSPEKKTGLRVVSGDVVGHSGREWAYNSIVKDHFFNPRNLLRSDAEVEVWSKQAHGIGQVKSGSCGDSLTMWITVDPDTKRITACKWRTFGCATALASTSVLSIMVTEKQGMSLEDAYALIPQDVVKRLTEIPTRKFHCTVLGDKALRAAVNDYYKRTGQHDKVKG